MSDLLVGFQGNVLAAFAGRTPRSYLSRAAELQGELLYQEKLSDPFSELQLVFSITQLPVGPGGWVIIWLTLVMRRLFGRLLLDVPARCRPDQSDQSTTGLRFSSQP